MSFIHRGDCKLLSFLWDKIIYGYNLFMSLRFTNNTFANFIIKAGILLVIYFLVKIIVKGIFTKPDEKPRQEVPVSVPIKHLGMTDNPVSKQPVQSTPIKNKRIQTEEPVLKSIEECISQDDIKFETDKADQEIIEVIQKNKKQIADTLKKANQKLDLSWMDSYHNILKVSNALDRNLIFYSRKVLEQNKFHYYTQLHFRSMRAADFVYKEYEKVGMSLFAIKEFENHIKKNPAIKKEYKKMISSQRDQIGSIRNYYLKRVQSLNAQTAKLRDKIGAECGKRGYEWRLKRMEHDK